MSLGPPRLVFEGVTVGDGVPRASIRGNLSAGETLAVEFAPVRLDGSAGLEILLVIDWSPGEGVLRKWTRVRLTGTDAPRLLKEVMLEDLDVGDGQVDLQSDGIQSYPAYIDGFFAGIEFPIAATRLTKDTSSRHLVIAHRPGITLQPGVWYESRKAVYGVAAPGAEKQAFERYVMSHRPGPRGLHVNYNSWWTSPEPYYTESDILGLMKTFAEQLYQRHKSGFDTFCIDMGWSNPQTIWEIDTQLFPRGFGAIERGAASVNAHLGLWISPSSQYPTALDNNWVESSGYETFMAPWNWRYACLGGARYREAFQLHLLDLVKRYSIRHVKFDGYQFICQAANHGHAPGALSAEACAAGLIEVFESVRAAAPDLWMEPTCFGFNPSPWWVFYTNSVIGAFGDDAPAGRVPCPVYRETYTTARDYFNLQGANLTSVPIAAQEVLGLVHQSPEPFMNDAVMTLMRGHMFLPLYVNPKFMSDSRWQALADFLRWARRNATALEETELLLPASWQDGKCPQITRDAPAPREPYGYAHWMNGRGIVALRNPWIAPASYPLKLKALPPDTKVAAVSLYPETRVYGRNLDPDGTLPVPLAPYETVVLAVDHVQPPKELPEAMTALGEGVKVRELQQEAVRVQFKSDSSGVDGNVEFGPDWTSQVGAASSVLQIQGRADVTVPGTGSELLLLREGADPLVTPSCRVTIDEREAKAPSTSCSATGWSAGAPSPEQWLFLRYALPEGSHRVQFEMSGMSDNDRLSAWIWTTKPGSSATPTYPNSLPGPEMISLSAAPLADTGTKSPPVIERPRPVTRINGVYLDALEPKAARMDYGKLQRNRNIIEKPIVIGTVRFLRGLGTHASARIVYDLGGAYRRFQAWAGPDAASNASITFEVRVDGRKVWESSLMKKGAAAEQIDIDVTAAQTLELVVGDGGDGINSDWADWADAKLLK